MGTVKTASGTDRAAGFVVPACDDGVMSSTASPDASVLRPKDRLEVLFDELGELMGQRNAIDGRIVDIVAELDRDNLVGMTGARSIAALVAWKTGSSARNAQTIAQLAHRLEEFPRCVAGLREGRLSLDQVGIIAEKAGHGSDEHYVTLAEVATVNQLRTALTLEPRPEPDPEPEPWPEPERSITKTSDEQSTSWRITLPHVDAATFDAALAVAPGCADHRSGNTTTPAASRSRINGRRCQTPPMRSWHWSRPGGTPRWRAAPTDSTPPWSCTSTSKTALRRCTWGRCSATPNADTCPVMPPARCGFTATGNPSAPDAAPARSTAGCVARWSTATAPARCPDAGPPAVCTPTTSATCAVRRVYSDRR